jgi:predicted ester cyclase
MQLGFPSPQEAVAGRCNDVFGIESHRWVKASGGAGSVGRRLDLAIASEILHPEVSFRGSVGQGAVGRAEVCDFVIMVTTALSNYRCDIEALIAEGPSAAAKVRFSGLHEGDFLGFPPTGRRVEWIGAAFFVAEEDMLRDIWVLGDLANLWTQLDPGD